MPQPQPKPVIGVLRKGCKVCGRRGKLFLCGGCDFARYCSASCQTKDWSAHQSNPVDEDGYEHAASIYYYGPAGYHPAG